MISYVRLFQLDQLKYTVNKKRICVRCFSKLNSNSLNESAAKGISLLTAYFLLILEPLKL